MTRLLIFVLCGVKMSLEELIMGYDKKLAELIANRRIDDGDNTLAYDKKLGLPKEYVRQCLTRPDMDDELMHAALMLEVDEDDLMKRYAKEKAVGFVRTNEFNKNVMSLGVDFTKGPHKTEFVYGLTPTLLMFVASHMSREFQTEEVYNPGRFRRFCEEYYETETDNEYKKIVTPEMWQKAVDDAIEYIISHYNPLERE